MTLTRFMYFHCHYKMTQTEKKTNIKHPGIKKKLVEGLGRKLFNFAPTKSSHFRLCSPQNLLSSTTGQSSVAQLRPSRRAAAGCGNPEKRKQERRGEGQRWNEALISSHRRAYLPLQNRNTSLKSLSLKSLTSSKNSLNPEPPSLDKIVK